MSETIKERIALSIVALILLGIVAAGVVGISLAMGQPTGDPAECLPADDPMYAPAPDCP